MKIAIIDDDQALLRSLELLLTSRGHEVYPFLNSRRAYEALQALHEVDLVISDYRIPDLSGFSLLKLLKLLPLKIRGYILMSAHTDEFWVKNFSDCGADCFIPKPLDFLVLLKTIQQFESKKTAGDDNDNLLLQA